HYGNEATHFMPLDPLARAALVDGARAFVTCLRGSDASCMDPHLAMDEEGVLSGVDRFRAARPMMASFLAAHPKLTFREQTRERMMPTYRLTIVTVDSAEPVNEIRIGFMRQKNRLGIA